MSNTVNNSANPNQSSSTAAPPSPPSLSASISGSQSFETTPPTSASTKDWNSVSDSRRLRSNKYGSLGRAASSGRVPLHRRGTSSKYETLEDLLREAGYKETRIFTPETERNAKSQDVGGGNDSDLAAQNARGLKGSLRGGVGAVVGFIAGLVGGKPEPSGNNEESARVGYSPPASPSPSPSPSPHPSRPAQQRQSSASSGSMHQQRYLAHQHSSSQLSSSVESLPHWNPKRPSAPSSRSSAYIGHGSRSHPYNSSSGYGQASTSSLRLPQVHETIPESPSNPSSPQSHHSHSHNHSHTRPNVHSTNDPSRYSARLHVPNALSGSRAGALLRHIASESSILPERPHSTPPSSAYRTGISQHIETDLQSNRHNNLQEANEAKRSWLQGIARTMLLGVPHSYDPPMSVPDEQHPSGASDNIENHSGNPQPPRLNRTYSNQYYSRPQRSTNYNPHRLQPGNNNDRPLMHWRTSDPVQRDSSMRRPTLHRSSSALSRSTRPGSNNTLAPPSLSRLASERSAQSEGEVSRARVVVRSAPGSRSNSRVRGEKGKERATQNGSRKKGLKGKGGGRKGQKDDDVDLPVLKRTKVEGDVWDMKKRGGSSGMQDGKQGRYMRYAEGEAENKRKASIDGFMNSRERRDSESTILEKRGREKTKKMKANRCVGGWGMQLPSPSPSPLRNASQAHSFTSSISIRPSSSSSARYHHQRHSTYSGSSDEDDHDSVSEESEDYESDSSEDAPEIDLARLLVPPKRQNSIRSLRRHLATQARMPPPALPNLPPAFARGNNDANPSRASSIAGRCPTPSFDSGLMSARSDQGGGSGAYNQIDNARKNGKWESAPPSASAGKESFGRRSRFIGRSGGGGGGGGDEMWTSAVGGGEGEDESVAQLSIFDHGRNHERGTSEKKRTGLPSAWVGWKRGE